MCTEVYGVEGGAQGDKIFKCLSQNGYGDMTYTLDVPHVPCGSGGVTLGSINISNISPTINLKYVYVYTIYI